MPYKQLQHHVENTRQHLKMMQRLQQPSTLKPLLPKARIEQLEAYLETLEGEPKRETACEAAQDLADTLRVEAERQKRALAIIARSLKGAVNDPAVCNPQFQEYEDERKRRAELIPLLTGAAGAFDRWAAECENPPVEPPPIVPKPKPGDDVLDRARRELEFASQGKDTVVNHYKDRMSHQPRKAKGAPEEPHQITEFDSNESKGLENFANMAHVASAEAHFVMANAMTDFQKNLPGSAGRPLRVQMRRADHADTPDTPFWMYIRSASTAIGWEAYSKFMEDILCSTPTALDANTIQTRNRVINRPLRLPFPDTDAYRFLKAATEVFLMVNCGVWMPWGSQLPLGPTQDELDYTERRLGISFVADDVRRRWLAYLTPPDGTPLTLPYLALIRQKLGDQPIVDPSNGDPTTLTTQSLAACSGIIRERLETPCLIELIWSYWHEEGMLVQTMNAISRRFQNIRTPGDRDPLAMIEIDPLRPLNNFLWGYIQDEQHRLTVVRRAYEYDHHYGLSLVGRAVPGVKGADSRKRFLEAFHQLLHLCTIFFKEDDDTTVIADGFPVLNALREVHIILSQGAHNQYGDLPWTARHEMLMQEWLLSRGEMREFLPSRIMVAYPEPWMDRVDAMKQLMGWTDTSVMHFRELGIYGERILLGARFNDWTTVIEPERAANWARFWRPEINSYIHAYRAVTGIDLNERAEATMPSTLLRNRLVAQRVGSR